VNTHQVSFASDAAWLLRLRCLAVVGQLATIFVVYWLLDVDLSLVALLALIGVTAASNLAFAIWLRVRVKLGAQMNERQPAVWLLVALMTLDLLTLTGLLFFSGGTNNPFAIFFLVNLALAGVVLPGRWAWALTCASMLCFAVVTFVRHPLEQLEHAVTTDTPSMWEVGALIAFCACSSVTTYFITRVTKELRRRESELRIAEQQRARSQRLEALATLAAGAGHELASPLSTIAVVAKELSLHLEEADSPDSVRRDVELIRSELDHCRGVLNRMAGHAGEVVGEENTLLPLTEFIEEVLNGLRKRERVSVKFEEGIADETICLPLDGAAQTLRGVLQNAIDASDEQSQVLLDVRDDTAMWRIATIDQGAGMSEETLARAEEPFFTTKEPGQGMGLGLFLAHSVVERLGGSVEIESTLGRGTTVVLFLPKETTESP